MDKNARILIVGHNDIIDRSLYQYFKSNGYTNVFSSSDIALDCTIQPSVYHFFSQERPDYVFLSSVKSGGIVANQKYPADFIYQNCEAQNNVIYAAYKFQTKKLLYFMGSCAYPKESPQPIKEEYLLTGPLESTSEPYSVAKIAGVKLCQSFRKQYGLNAIIAVPATVYGPESDMNLENAHVINALIRKFAEAKKSNAEEIVVWGSGQPRREFLYSDDFVSASLFLMDYYNDEGIINVGCGKDVSIKELAEIIQEVSGYEGKLVFDASKPDGVMKKLMDNSLIVQKGWAPKVSLKDGIQKTYS